MSHVFSSVDDEGDKDCDDDDVDDNDDSNRTCVTNLP